MDESKLLTLFPSVLLIAHVADHAAIAKRLVPEIDKIRVEVPNGPAARWACPVFSTLTSDPFLHRRDAFHEIAGIFHEEILAFAQRKSVDVNSPQISIDRCWLNVLSRGHSMDVHTHPNSFFTGIYFLQAPTAGASLCLHNPTQEIGLSVPIKKETPLNQEGYTYQPVAGDLVMFDSCIAHSFRVHQSAEEHINLSFTAAGPVTSATSPS